MFNKKIQKRVGLIVFVAQIFSALTPALTFAAPQSVSGTDTKNALESTGTKANRLKTLGESGVDESSGAFTYSYPLQVPKGKNGMEPSMAISYNSQNSENSIFGFGMSFTIPSIERSARFGVDKIYSKNDFVSTVGGELILKPGTTNQYIQKIDDGSYQLYTFSNDIWTLTDRSGNTYTFGSTLDSRLSDNSGTKIQKYFLTNVKDTLGNQIKYFYEKKNNFVYPKEIVYTQDRFGAASNKIVFERESRTDAEVSYKSGFRVTMDDRIKSVKFYTDSVLVGQVDLVYTTGQNGTRSLLSTISESRMGTDGVMTTMPATKFDYQIDITINRSANGSMQSNQGYQDINGDAKPEIYSTTDGAPAYGSWKVIDYNGDYIPDMYYYVQQQTYCNGYCGNYWLPAEGALKLGNSNIVFPVSKLASLTFPFTADYHWLYRGVDNGSVILDVNADGFQDVAVGKIVSVNNGGTGFVNSGFSNNGFTHLIDVNGDSLPDIINDKQVYLNNGNGFNNATETKFIVPVEYTVSLNGREYDAGVRFTDFNSDGLIDIVRSYKAKYFYGWGGGTGTITGNNVYINNGKEWVLSNTSSVDGYISDSYLYYNPTGPEQLTVTKSDIIDTNTDGSFPIKKQDILKTVTNPLGAKSDITYKGSATGNNPKLPINILVVDQVKETETLKGLVETTTYTFENGKMYYDANNIYDRRFAGFGKVTTVKGETKAIKYFHQGDGDDTALNERGDSFYNIGKVFRQELWGKVGTVETKFSESYKNFGNYVYGGQIYNYPKYEVNSTFDTNGGKLTKAVSYDYDLASRLPKQVTNFGEANFDPVTGVIGDIKEDAIITKNIYNTKRPQKLLSEESTDANGKFLDKKVYFYDELPFGYVERGLLTESRNYSSANVYVRSSSVYFNSGLLQSTIDNNGNATSYIYDPNNNPISVTNTLGQKSFSETNKWLGLETKNTDANGKITQTVYDGFGRVKNVSASVPSAPTPLVQLVTNKTYSYGVGFTQTENIFKDGAVYKTVTSNYDTFGRLIATTETVGTSAKRVDNTYNNLGQLVSTTYPYDANGLLGTYNSTIDTRYTYDSLGRATAITQGDNQSYISYGVTSKTVSDNSATGHLKTYTYNSQDKIISVSERNGATTNTTKYTWNLLGNLTSITDAEGNVRNFQYDGEGRLLKQEDLHNPSDNKFGVYTYTYDALGNLLTKTDPTLNKFTYTYDQLYRPTSESPQTPGGLGLTTTYAYDNCQNGVGKVCSISNSDYTQTFKYKLTGDIESESKTIDSKTFTNTYSYNSLGQVVAITLPDNSVLNYSHDNNGKQKSVSLSSADDKITNFVTDAKYNIDGTIKEVSYGNNTKSCYSYATNNGAVSAPRLSDIYTFVGSDCANASKTNANNLYVESLNYNKEGSIIKNTEKYVKDSGDIVSNFTYDELNRLTSTSVLENNLTKVNNINYSPIGNILSSDSTNYNYLGTDYANPNAPTTIGNKSITYDPNGNVLSDGKNVYNWTTKNTLAKQENDKSISSYVYDINGERIKETVKVKSSATETSQYSVKNDTYITFAQATTSKVDTYISENSFNELNTAKLTSENKISMLFALAFETSYPQKVCVGKTDPNCQKAEAEKFVGAFLYSKYNILLSNTTLEEMYSVYLGQMLVGNSLGDYAKNSTNKYVNKINATTTLIASLSTTTVAKEVASTTNKTLMGYVYRENKIPSLFGVNKLLSKESFNELTTLGLTYTNLVIYDRLVAYSFAPYAPCEALSGEALYNCRKTILVKHLYAIVKYEKGLEVSNYTLDEIAEVILGNLTVPNNSDEYYVTEVKNISTNGVINTAQYLQQYTPSLGMIGGCGVGTFAGAISGAGAQSTTRCINTFSIPAELTSRAKEVSKIEIENFQASENIAGLRTFLNISNPFQTSSPYPSQTDINTGTVGTYSTEVFNYQLGSVMNVDVTNSLLPWVQGKTGGTGLRFSTDSSSANPNGIQITTPGTTLKVTFKKDTDQALRAYATPLVINPKDSTVENNVLSVLARVDKDYVATSTTIISRESFEEVKNSLYVTNDKVKELFDQNEKLQKDDTLSAVWTNYKQKYSQELTRESLEELYMVWKDQLGMPEEYNQYMYSVSTSTKVLATVGSSTLKTYMSVSRTVPSTEAGVNYLTFYIDPTFKVFERSKMSNLSVVPGVFSMRFLGDDDIITVKKLLSSDSINELATAGINNRADILQFTTTIVGFTASSTIPKVNKIDNLSKINSEIIRIKNIKLSREALEEIYYILNNKLVFSASDLPGNSIIDTTGAIANYKLEGTLNSTDKKKDDLRPGSPIYIENSVTSVPGRKGESNGAYDFNGSAYLAMPNITPVPTNGSYTFSTWVKTSGSADSFIMQMGAPGTPYNYIRLQLWHNLINTEVVSGGGFTTYNMGGKALNDNKWHKVDFVLDNTGPVKSTIYIDGVKDSEATFTGKHNFANISNELLLGVGRNPGASNMLQGHFTGSVDEFKIWNKALSATEVKTNFDNDNTSNAVIIQNLGTFGRAFFGVLDPINNVTSQNETQQTDNRVYNLTSNDIKIVSDETKGELGLVGITTRQQIVDIMGKTPVVYKDSKMHFFREYIKENKGFELSRQALEEVYLIYSGKEVLLTSDSSTNISNTKTLDTVDTTFTLRQLPTGTAVTSCVNSNTKGTNPNGSTFYDQKSCEVTVTVPQIIGYNTVRADLKFTGANSLIPVTVSGVKSIENPSGGVINLLNYANIAGKYVVTFSAYMDNYGSNNSATLGNFTLVTSYDLPNTKQDRNNFASLETVSTFADLKDSYDKEVANLNLVFNLPTTSTTTIPQLSTDTQSELASTALKTVADVKNIFATASSIWSKETKLYNFFLKVKQTSGVELTRAALEEMWNINSGTETILAAASTTPATTTITKAYPFVKGTYTAFTWNGATNYDNTWCMVLGYATSECYIKFTYTPEAGYTIKNANITMNSWNYGYSPIDGTFYKPLSQPANNTRPSVTEYPQYKFTLTGVNGTAGFPFTRDISKLVNDSTVYNNTLYIGLGKTSAQLYAYPNTVMMVNPGADGYGGIYGVKDPTLSITWEKLGVATITIPYFDRSTLSTYVVSSPMDTLQQKYVQETNASTSTINTLVNGTSTQPAFCNSIIQTCDIATTTLTSDGKIATTTTLVDLTQTTITDTTPTCANIVNPYSYSFTVDANCVPTFILPNGATTSDGTVKVYNTIAKNLNSSKEEIYTKFYPSAYYEYDSRGVVTINIPFNGKVVGTYKYQGELSEVSYIHNSYNATPVLITNSTGSTTEVIKRDVWGDMLSNNYNSNEIIPTSYGLTGHKWDDNTGITYSHARYLSNKNKVWLSHDPFSIENFNKDVWLMDPQTQNSYSYSKNNPVNNVDPDGKLTIIVPGTWYSNSTWMNQCNPLQASAINSWHDPNTIVFNDRSKWSGGNNDIDRQTAANNLADLINEYKFADGEMLNIVMHSHGGNVGKIALRMLNEGIKVDNFVTLGTPVTDRYKTDMSRVKNMLEVYSDYDWTQVNGGDSMKIGGLAGWAANRGRTDYKGIVFGYFETGMASRFESTKSAVDVTSQTSFSYTSVSKTHGELHSVMSIWTNSVDSKLIKNKK